jgi:hypothetical protein
MESVAAAPGPASSYFLVFSSQIPTQSPSFDALFHFPLIFTSLFFSFALSRTRDTDTAASRGKFELLFF